MLILNNLLFQGTSWFSFQTVLDILVIGLIVYVTYCRVKSFAKQRTAENVKDEKVTSTEDGKVKIKNKPEIMIKIKIGRMEEVVSRAFFLKRKNSTVYAAKTEIKIPTNTKEIGKRAFFSIKNAISKIGTNTEINNM